MKFISVLLIAAIIACQSAFAGTVTMHFTGVVTAKGSQVSGQLDEIEVGDAIEGYFSYDPAATSDTNAWDVYGTYPFDAAGSLFSFTVYDASAGGEILFDLEGSLAEIITQNNWTYPNYPVIDAFTPHANLANGWEVYLYFQNRDTNLEVITSDTLPVPPPPFDQFNHTQGRIANPTAWGDIDFSTQSLTLVMILCDGDLDQDADVDGEDLEQFSRAFSNPDLEAFAVGFGRLSGCTELY